MLKEDKSLKELIDGNSELSEVKETFNRYKQTIWSKWLRIVIFGFTGAAVGFLLSFVLKPKYEAHLSFAMLENDGGGKLSSIASMFGFGSLTGGGNGAYSGNNLLEILKSQYMIQNTLLKPVQVNGNTTNIVSMYIDTYKLEDKWKHKDDPELQNLKFPVGQNRESFSRVQDSILFLIFKRIDEKMLDIAQNDPDNSIVDIHFISENETMSKVFTETLVDETYTSYKETKTSQNRVNINMLQYTADSVKALYDNALVVGAGISQANVNSALMYAAVPKIKKETDIQIYATIYSEILKNLETIKLEMARETPILQIIDRPIYPLKKKRLGHIIGFGVGGILGGFLTILFYSFIFYIKNILRSEIERKNKS